MKHYYRLSGKAEEMAHKIKEKNNEIAGKIHSYLEDLFGKKEPGIGIIRHGTNLSGVPAIDPLPKHFKKVSSEPKFMCPRLSTKLGKEEDKRWREEFTSVNSDEVCEHLGVSNFQIMDGRSFLKPRAIAITGGVFFVSSDKVEHEDAEEILVSVFEDAIDTHNEKAEKEK